MFKLIWPLLIAIGILFVLVFDVGNGLDSPGFWLIPIGVIGGLVSLSQNKSSGTPVSNNSQQKGNNNLLIVVWLLAFFNIGGIYFGYFTDGGFGRFIYFWPAIIFTLMGLVLLMVRLVRR